MSFWCVTTFFNPAGYQSLTNNYFVFKNKLARQRVRLLTMELAFGDAPFYLPESLDVIHLRGNSVMWHKERLINYAVSILPDTCSAYAWIDCDLIFSDDWLAKSEKQLEKHDVIQLFKRVYYLPRGDKEYQGRQLCMFQGIVYQRDWEINWLRGREEKLLPFAAPGFAWAARRDAFGEAGIYDRVIVGSGDAVLTDCLFNCWSLHGHEQKYNDATKRDIREWSATIEEKKLSVGYLPIDIFHLWHGNSKNRKYMGRHNYLLAHNFDPKVDIILKNNVYEWATPKTQMHEDVKQYFNQRREDDI